MTRKEWQFSLDLELARKIGEKTEKLVEKFVED
jgi:hypothetical protein